MTNAPTVDSVLGSARPLIEAGASLHWLVPFEKRPIATDWSNAPLQTEAALRASYRENANIGIRLGEPSKTEDGYLHLIDLDIRKPELAAEAWAKLLELWPAARTFPSGISGSGGESRHLYFSHRHPLPEEKARQIDRLHDGLRQGQGPGSPQVRLGDRPLRHRRPSRAAAVHSPRHHACPTDGNVRSISTSPSDDDSSEQALIEQWGVSSAVAASARGRCRRSFRQSCAPRRWTWKTRRSTRSSRACRPIGSMTATSG